MRIPSLLIIALALTSIHFTPHISAQTIQHEPQVTLNRKIELMVRSKFNIPDNCNIQITSRAPSSIPGYDTLRLSITNGKQDIGVDFLISNDDKTLARLEKFDLDSNPALTIDLRGRPIRGNPDAPVTVVSFDDLECPVCARMHQILFPGTLDHYGNRVRFIYMDNPLLDIHPWAMHAAVNANCLADQSANAYWSYVDYVHSHGEEVSGQTRNLAQSYSTLDQIASRQGLKANVNANQLQACLKKQDETPVRQSMKEAARLGLNFTPALFINGEEIRGLATENEVWNVIDRALRETSVASPQQKMMPVSK